MQVEKHVVVVHYVAGLVGVIVDFHTLELI